MPRPSQQRVTVQATLGNTTTDAAGKIGQLTVDFNKQASVVVRFWVGDLVRTGNLSSPRTMPSVLRLVDSFYLD